MNSLTCEVRRNSHRQDMDKQGLAGPCHSRPEAVALSSKAHSKPSDSREGSVFCQAHERPKERARPRKGVT